jgi:hypothetical protein
MWISFPGRNDKGGYGLAHKRKRVAVIGWPGGIIYITISVPGNDFVLFAQHLFLKIQQTFACLFCSAVSYFWMKGFINHCCLICITLET